MERAKKDVQSRLDFQNTQVKCFRSLKNLTTRIILSLKESNASRVYIATLSVGDSGNMKSIAWRLWISNCVPTKTKSANGIQQVENYNKGEHVVGGHYNQSPGSLFLVVDARRYIGKWENRVDVIVYRRNSSTTKPELHPKTQDSSCLRKIVRTDFNDRR
jgi:hypothetical protein